MFSFLYSKPCHSRLSDEEYTAYKYGFEEALKRSVTFDLECPVIEFDDSKKHIILRSFYGCVSDNLIIVPDGITIVYVDEDDTFDFNKLYNLVVPDTLQSIDYLPENLKLKFLDTNKLESIRLKDSDFESIDTVIVRNDFNFKKCIGHLNVRRIYYALDKSYNVDKTHLFITKVDGLHSEIYINDYCKSISLNSLNIKLILYGKNDKLKSKMHLIDNNLSIDSVVQDIINYELKNMPV